MGSNGACTLEFSHTLRITQRSQLYFSIPTLAPNYSKSHRILLASIKSLGLCLCPQCKVQKPQVPKLGMKRDNTWHEREERDSTTVSYKVRTEAALDAIYKQGRAVHGTVVQELLGNESTVPTTVSQLLKCLSCVEPHA